MTCQQPGVSTFPNLRHYRPLRTFSLVLVLAGTVACNGENPVSPGPQAAGHSLVQSGPTTVSFLSYLTPDEEAQAEVRSMDAEVSWMDSELGGPEPLQFGATGINSTTKKGPSRRGNVTPTDPLLNPNFFVADPCKLEYTECLYRCLLTKLEFDSHRGDYFRDAEEFWENTFTGRWYLNRLEGGPQDRLANSLYWMRFHFRNYQAMDCKSYRR